MRRDRRIIAPKLKRDNIKNSNVISLFTRTENTVSSLLTGADESPQHDGNISVP